MRTTITPDGLGPVQETMLITLWARAQEAARPDAILRDEHAAELLATIDYDFDRFRRGWKSQVGVAVRSARMDERVRRHLRQHESATVVNLGAGLDTRFERVDNGRTRWIDVDAEDAIGFRRQVLSRAGLAGRSAHRRTMIAGSVLEPAWLHGLDVADPAQVIVVAEGVLMFFPPQAVRTLLEALARAFPGGSLLFDGIGPLMVRLPRLHDTLPRTLASVRFRWGATPRRLRGFIEATPGCTLSAVSTLLDCHRARWRWMAAVNALPPMANQFYLASIRLGGAAPPAPVRAGSARIPSIG